MKRLYAQILGRAQRLGPNSYKVATAFGMRGISAVLAFALSWTLARLYEAEGFGTYSVAVTTAMFTCYIAIVGQDYVALRTVAGELKVGHQGAARGVVRVATAIAAGTAVIAAIIVAAASDWLGERIGNRASADMMVLVAPAVLGLVLARTASWALRGAGNVVVSQAIEGVTTPALILAVLLGALAVGTLPPLWSIGALYVAGSFAAAAVGWIAWALMTRTWPAAEKARPAVLLAAGIPMMIATVSNAIADWAAIFSTNFYAGAAAAGQLRVALQMMLVVTLLLSSFDAIVGPQVAAAWKVRDMDALRRIFRKATIGMTAATAPILLVLLFFPGWLMSLFGEGFADGARALQIIAIAQLLTIAAGPMGLVLIMSGHDKTLLWYSMGGFAVIGALSLFVVPIYGVTGGAIVVAGNMIFRRVAAQITLRYVAKLDLSVWRSRRKTS